MIYALAVFAATYAVIALGRVPGLKLDRAGAALLGAAAMVAGGSLSLRQAFAAIDMSTIVLLLGMMILVANLKLAGFFELCAAYAGRHAHRPLVLLLATVTLAGLLSAFLVNDTVCVMLAPLIAQTAAAMKRQVEPYLLALAMASNAGSVATITGNPQNIVIGSVSHIPYTDFTAHLAPVALAALVVVAALTVLFYRADFAGGARMEAEPASVRVDRMQLVKSLAATLGAVAAFFLGVAPAEAAIVAGALLLLTRRQAPERIWGAIDWPLLVLFAGLFIVVRGFELAVLTAPARANFSALHLDNAAMLAAATGVLSNLVSNVPAVLLLRPVVEGLRDPHKAFLVLAMASTLAGNLTITGSIANLIVVERARAAGVTISFWRYLRLGVPVTLLTMAFGVWWLA